MKEKRSFGILSVVGKCLLLLFCCAAVLLAVSKLEQGSREQGRLLLEDALRRTAVACYAAEGTYPPDVAYMETHYGLQIDRSRYLVDYEIFASNLMPQISVMERSS
ncbi:MAG: hypothetical protein E7458_06650 [Ruminococcaceae bacterium]|nr:hypothetical protein [Oscillospiraceae bacterium]